MAMKKTGGVNGVALSDGIPTKQIAAVLTGARRDIER
jgi:hypothetical protein